MKYFLILIFLFLISCKEKYHGYIYDSIDRKPIINAEIHDIKLNKSTYTDSMGYYILRWEPSNNFFIKKEGYIIDSIQLFSFKAGEIIQKNMDGNQRNLFQIWTGNIYDESTKKTISNVKIYNLNKQMICVTNFDGYFELHKFPDSTLVLKKENYINDTIHLYTISNIRTQTIAPLRKIKNEKYFIKHIKY